MATTSSKSKFPAPVNVRLSPDKHFLYQSQAEALGKSYSVYLRERLESQDLLLEELRALNHKMQTLTLPDSSPQTSFFDRGILIEILLLLRSSSSPSRLRMIHAELEQQGFTVWDEIQEPSA